MKTISSQYIIPETRSATIALLDPKGLLDGVEVSEAEIKTTYEEAIESYKLPEQRILDQAVLSSESQAKTVVEKAKAGSDLESAVKSATGNTKAYSGKSSFQKDGLMKEIAEPVFAAKSGDVVGPIQTPLGWHVLLVKEITPESTQPLEKVSEQIRKDLMQNKSSDQVYALTSQIEDRLAGGEALESLAKEYKLTLISVPSFRKDSKNVPSLKPLASNEEAIINSMLAAESMTGYQGRTVQALPPDKLKEILKKYGVFRATVFASRHVQGVGCVRQLEQTKH